jgi:hypothetical protein
MSDPITGDGTTPESDAKLKADLPFLDDIQSTAYGGCGAVIAIMALAVLTALSIFFFILG